MSISAQPFAIAAAKPLKPMFDALGLSGPDPIVIGPASAGVHESETLNLTPGEKSLKARILTLIENNRPSQALDLMQKTAREDRELFDDLLFDVEEALDSYDYDSDVEELKRIAAEPQIEEPKVDYGAVQNTLVLG